MVHKTLSAIALKDIYHGTLYHLSHLEILRQRPPGLREFVKIDVMLTLSIYIYICLYILSIFDSLSLSEAVGDSVEYRTICG